MILFLFFKRLLSGTILAGIPRARCHFGTFFVTTELEATKEPSPTTMPGIMTDPAPSETPRSNTGPGYTFFLILTGYLSFVSDTDGPIKT